jgi:hypothetical protein
MEARIEDSIAESHSAKVPGTMPDCQWAGFDARPLGREAGFWHPLVPPSAAYADADAQTPPCVPRTSRGSMCRAQNDVVMLWLIKIRGASPFLPCLLFPATYVPASEGARRQRLAGQAAHDPGVGLLAVLLKQARPIFHPFQVSDCGEAR